MRLLNNLKKPCYVWLSVWLEEIKKVCFLYSAVSSPLDRSTRFTLSSPGRPVHSDTNMAFLGCVLAMQQLRERRLFINISTTVYSQVLIYTGGIMERTKLAKLRNGSKGDSPGLSQLIASRSSAFYQKGLYFWFYRWAAALHIDRFLILSGSRDSCFAISVTNSAYLSHCKTLLCVYPL